MPTKPHVEAPVTEVVSLDALAQQRRDALPSPTTFELFGVSFTLPPMKSLPLAMQQKVNIENGVAVLSYALGEAKLKEMYDAGFLFSDLELIAEEWLSRAGLQPGESQASPSS